MSGQQVRTAVCARLTSLGYQWRERRGHEDILMDPQNGHRLTLAPYPRWGRRIDVITLLSSFPLHDDRATAFQLDLGSQVHPDAAAVPGRWRSAEVEQLIDEHLLGYAERARSVGDVLDMLLAGEIRPMGSAGARAVVQHGYYLAKWWQLGDRLDRLREVAYVVPATDRAEMRRAPWGRTEIAEVLWYGRDLTPPPPRLPWGPGDQGDPRAERWFRTAAAGGQARQPRPAESPAVPSGVLRGHGSH
jgi:hypothetical protein